MFRRSVLLRFDLTTGEIEVVDAGSPTLWRIRGAVTERVELDRQLPLGMVEDTVYAPQRLRLPHGDRPVSSPAARASPGPRGRTRHRTRGGTGNLLRSSLTLRRRM
ncbi:hypothetical protein ASC82_13480 [Streptomyces sp. Root431]|uniref:SpoIIE family protein phosphatase n=1 Tax=Streptomyces sp. Root431 TaxID=1736535 RepID=UPI0007001C08|nr:hypothetical protein ASC82_13480 [Streptomyces sp. Root431]